MTYAAIDTVYNRFYLTGDKDIGVTMNGKLLEFDDDDEALDFIDSLNNSFGEEPPMGITVKYSVDSGRFNVSANTQ